MHRILKKLRGFLRINHGAGNNSYIAGLCRPSVCTGEHVCVLCMRLVWRMCTVGGLVAGLRAAHSKNGGSIPGENKRFFPFSEASTFTPGHTPPFI